MTPSHITRVRVGGYWGRCWGWVGGGWGGACVSASSAPYQRTDDAPFNPHFHEAIPLEPCSPQVLIPYLLIPFSPRRRGILAEQAAFEAQRAGGPLECVCNASVTLPDVRPLMADSQRAVLQCSRRHLAGSSLIISKMFF